MKNYDLTSCHMRAQLCTNFSIHLITDEFSGLFYRQISHIFPWFTLLPVTCYLTSLSFMAQRPSHSSSTFLGLLRSSPPISDTSSCSSFSTVRLHASRASFFSFPLCRPVCCDVAVITAILHKEVTNPIFYQRYFTSSVSRCMLALFNSSLLLSSCSHFIWKIFRKHLLWKTATALSSPVLLLCVSHPYICNCSTVSVLDSYSVVFLEMLWNSKSSSV